MARSLRRRAVRLGDEPPVKVERESCIHETSTLSVGGRGGDRRDGAGAVGGNW